MGKLPSLAEAIRNSLAKIGARIKILFIEPGTHEDGYVEPLIGTLKDELLNEEIIETLMEAMLVIEILRRKYNRIRLHSSFGYKPTAL